MGDGQSVSLSARSAAFTARRSDQAHAIGGQSWRRRPPLGEGEVHRHLRKLLKVYEERRQLMCTLFKDKLGDYVQFNAPPGGLAMWTQWDPSLNLMRISKNCQKKKLHLPPTLLYQNEHTTAMRLGFGNLNQEELVMAVSTLEEAVKSSGVHIK